ncbi:hypothetical protein BUALT_Bualt06G0000700 [Buddleja alternifolia]|uniref:Auxin efflux carrier component n=1 Tax=Buddleja alternifolia TaxID=168488 RepID=A0AAV6XBQ1_9LAMI|nr:hypothetical protein BUALT_Bualt06G0000700 [Buddleja alternifolia]
MIGWEDVYKVVVAMVPLYVSLGLGYGSVKWWRMFKPDQCDAINRFNCYFIIPFFTFQFTASVNPYRMNYRFLAGDIIAKAIAGAILALWANLCRNGNFSWAITSFSLSSFNNTLVIGVPLLKAMYGAMGEDLVVQSSVIQSLLWFPLLLFMLEFRRTIWINNNIVDDHDRDQVVSSNNNDPPATGQLPQQQQHIFSIEIVSSSEVAITKHDEMLQQEEQNNNNNNNNNKTPTTNNNIIGVVGETKISSPFSFGSTMKKVWGKLAKNPNSYACAIGLIWALLAKRWDLEMPSIVEGSIQIMAKAGSGVAMFSMGLFMALQEKVIACGVRLTMYSMVLRFIGGPLTSVVGALALGLRGTILRIAIIQAALPQAIASFVFAQEYCLHANVLSTSVIFGTIISLPLLIVYYLALDVLH